MNKTNGCKLTGHVRSVYVNSEGVDTWYRDTPAGSDFYERRENALNEGDVVTESGFEHRFPKPNSKSTHPRGRFA